MAKQVTNSSLKNSERLIQEIEAWLLQSPKTDEFSFPNFIAQKRDDLEQAFHRWLQVFPEEQRLAFLEIIDQLVIQLANFVHKSTKCSEVEKNILIEGRLFYSELASLADMQRVPYHQLEYIEEKFKSKYRLYALMQGAVSGVGHSITTALDFPVLLAINLKIIQYIAGTYGYSLRSPKEQIIALHILYAVTLPNHYRQEAWEWVLTKIDREDQLDLLIDQEEMIVQQEWLETLAKHWLKSFALYGLNKGTRKGISLLGVLLGANINYSFTRQASQFASYIYRFRYLHEQEEKSRQEG